MSDHPQPAQAGASTERPIALVTGASGGIGFEMARGLVARGVDVWIVARPGPRGEEAARTLREEAGREEAATFLPADLSSLSEVRRLAVEVEARLDRLDLLIHNAGIFVHQRRLTDDGFERTWAVNHLAPFLLTHLVTGPLRAAQAPRVVVTSSNAERAGEIDLERAASGVPYSAWRAYGWSKQANIHFARELDRRAPIPGLRAYAFHPGFVATRFGHEGGGIVGALIKLTQRLFARDSQKGAETGVWLATAEPAPEPSGGYFVDHAAVTPSAAARDEAMTRELWTRSEDWVGLGADERWPAPAAEGGDAGQGGR
jgi:NAD(P)-dependent dehydrogenase (short-subunit alcohol dehydrogenase family)